MSGLPIPEPRWAVDLVERFWPYLVPLAAVGGLVLLALAMVGVCAAFDAGATGWLREQYPDAEHEEVAP